MTLTLFYFDLNRGERLKPAEARAIAAPAQLNNTPPFPYWRAINTETRGADTEAPQTVSLQHYYVSHPEYGAVIEAVLPAHPSLGSRQFAWETACRAYRDAQVTELRPDESQSVPTDRWDAFLAMQAPAFPFAAVIRHTAKLDHIAFDALAAVVDQTDPALPPDFARAEIAALGIQIALRHI